MSGSSLDVNRLTNSDNIANGRCVQRCSVREMRIRIKLMYIQKQAFLISGNHTEESRPEESSNEGIKKRREIQGK